MTTKECITDVQLEENILSKDECSEALKGERILKTKHSGSWLRPPAVFAVRRGGWDSDLALKLD
jgi:hypothetical protein